MPNVDGDRTYSVYELTDRGKSLGPVLDALYAWGETAAPDLGVKVELSSKS
jgi:DNA-binding HxlR family transcriptional regulator